MDKFLSMDNISHTILITKDVKLLGFDFKNNDKILVYKNNGGVARFRTNKKGIMSLYPLCDRFMDFSIGLKIYKLALKKFHIIEKSELPVSSSLQN